MPRSRTPGQGSTPRDLEPHERVHYRDRFREARYAALADAEGFGAICFALEALGLRLLGKQWVLEQYKPKLADCAANSPTLTDLPERFPSTFKSFEALFKTVQTARNDAMHIGAYARHATEAAIELSIGLEEALMANFERKVKDVMVKSPMTVEPWQPVAQARQLMLMHSFSFLPVRIGRSWWLVSEIGLAKFLNGDGKKDRLAQPIQDAKAAGMQLVRLREADLLHEDTKITEVLERAKVQKGPTLWLVIDKQHPDHLAGVLSPFELM